MTIKITTCVCILLFSAHSLRAQLTKATVRLSHEATLALIRAPFNATEKKLAYTDEKRLYAINDRVLFGTDGELPKYVLQSATLTLKQQVYHLEVANMYNPWLAGAPDSALCKITRQSDRQYRLQMLLSDGAGSYYAEWRIVGEASIRTALSNDEDICVDFTTQ